MVNLSLLKKALWQGLYLSLVFIGTFLVNDYFHFINLKITDTDFYLDAVKQINKFDDNKLITMPLYVVEITDSDIEKYALSGYALPKSIINKILYRYERSDASLLFLDLDISKPSCIESQKFAEVEFELLDILNNSKKKVILPFIEEAPLYEKINNSLISLLSVEYLTDDLRVTRYSTERNGRESASYRIYKSLSQSDANLSVSSNWIDSKLSKIILYKEYEGNDSYYSGLSKISLSQFLEGKNNYLDAIFMIGRVDKNAHDSFSTPIGVIPGIHINANAVMSMFYYGEIKSYYLINIFMAFLLGFSFTYVLEFLKSKPYIPDNIEEFLAGLGIMLFSFICVTASYFLLEFYSIWLDYQKVVFVFVVYETVRIISSKLSESKLLKKGKE